MRDITEQFDSMHDRIDDREEQRLEGIEQEEAKAIYQEQFEDALTTMFGCLGDI